MGIRQKQVQVKDQTITIETLPATEGLALAAAIARILAGAGAGVKDIPTSLKELPEALHVGRLVQGILDRMDPESLPAFLKKIVRQSLPEFRDKPDAVFDEWYEDGFAGNLSSLSGLVWEILDLNFKDVLDLLTKKLAGVSVRVPSTPASGEQSGRDPNTNS